MTDVSPVSRIIDHRSRGAGAYPLDKGVGDKARLYSHRSFVDRLQLLRCLHAHTGCVNTLSWSSCGRLLLSGSDDTTVRLWRFANQPPLEDGEVLRPLHTIHTGHTENIFNAKFLPFSGNRDIVTCAADGNIFLYNLEYSCGSARSTAVKNYQCHEASVKRIATDPYASNIFYTCSEDGTVRQIDLREAHSRCEEGACGPAYIDYSREAIGFESISLSLLRPHLLAIAGTCPALLVHDRRMIGGGGGGGGHSSSPLADAVMTGRENRKNGLVLRCVPAAPWLKNDAHVTAVKFSDSNGHELVGNWSCREVYLFDIDADAVEGSASTANYVSTEERARTRNDESYSDSDSDQDNDDNNDNDDDDDSDNGSNEDEGNTSEAASRNDYIPMRMRFILERGRRGGRRYRMFPHVSSVPCIGRYSGHCNVQTVKDVNFFGAHDEYIVSGSDDGCLFIWDKRTAKIVQVLKGDTEIVNIVQPHPYEPTLAVSGIDDYIKIFSPSDAQTYSSRKKSRRRSSSDLVVERRPRRRRQIDTRSSPQSHASNTTSTRLSSPSSSAADQDDDSNSSDAVTAIPRRVRYHTPAAHYPRLARLPHYSRSLMPHLDEITTVNAELRLQGRGEQQQQATLLLQLILNNPLLLRREPFV